MKYDVIVIGGGQSGLATGYYLRRSNHSFVILDGEEEPGGAWQHMWNSLRLFSPAQWSSLPGVIMPGGGDYYPTRKETLDYLRNYESKYQLPVRRPVKVSNVVKKDDVFHVTTNAGEFTAKAVVCATGSFQNPFLPPMEGQRKFQR
jgi:Predicted flavoprotein involved in K+ transport